MLGLPKSTELKKQLPKSAIYKKFSMNTVAKERFDADVSRIDIANEVSPSNTTIAAGETVQSFYVLLVSLKKAELDEKNIITLSKLIDQNMLFVLAFDKKAKLAVYHTKLMQGEWMPIDELSVPLTGLSMDSVWENIVIQIGNVEMEQGNTLDEQIRRDEERAKLQKQIEALEKQAWNEKQPKRKFELAQEIKNLQRELEG
jgi:hypothetical protein